MTKNMVIKCIAAGSGIIAAFTVGAAGLALSDAPMFVTETLEPNVIISPVYRYEYNEVSLIDPPSAEYVACGGIVVPGITCTTTGVEPANILLLPDWTVSTFNSSLNYGWRVTPWPRACVTANNADCRLGSTGKLYSQIAVYPNDSAIETSTSGGTIENLFPLHYLYTSLPSPVDYNLPREEPYPDAEGGALGATVIDGNNRGKTRYLRSNKNFLYFNEAVANLTGRTGVALRGYEAWPSLGGYTFTGYADSTSAATAFYNPLKRTQSVVNAAGATVTVDITANLASAGTSFLYAYPGAGTTFDAAIVNQPVHIGQYWNHNGLDVHDTGAVWKSTSYAGRNWDGSGGLTAMSDANKINFAHWFTYWRSSYLATRGILSNLIFELDRADILDRFRVGIHYQRHTSVPTLSYICAFPVGTGLYGSTFDPACFTTIQTLQITYPLDVKTVKGAALVNALAQDIFASGSIFTAYGQNSETTGTLPPIYGHKRVTNYFQTTAPYRDDPSDSNSTPRSCRRNYEIIVTPDYIGLRHDSAPNIGTVSDQYEATLEAKYQDGVANQWGDVGAYGWVTDLMPSLDNTLLPGVRDSQTQQHLVRYVVGPRAAGIKFPDTTDTFTEADTVLNTMSSTAWAASRTAFGGSAKLQYSIDDLWHMALNSRGFFYQSNDVRDTVEKLLAAFNDVLVRNVSGSAVATNATSLQLGGRVYQATVETDWKGHLLAYNITPVTTTVNNVSKTVLTLDYGSPAWDLAEKVSAMAQSARNVLTFNGTAGVPFRWANLNTAAQDLLKLNVPVGITAPNDYGNDLVEYLRGSGECEDGASTTCTSGVPYTFRRRNLERTGNGLLPYTAANPNGRNVLGDIANSSPWYTSAPTAGLSDVDYPGYNQHRTTHKARGNVLYVGSNDGMVHAVDAGTTSSAGSELFAYVPSFVHYTDTTAGVIACSDARNHGLQCLADSAYGHKFYADGSPFSAEADLGADGWRTVLAGGANKGGKGYYLLDVTNVGKTTAVTEADAASIVRWEFTHPDLHYTFNLPVTVQTGGQARQIARMNDGKWALIVGNGYPEAALKQACLFIIYLSGPTGASNTWVENTDYRKLCVGVNDYSTDGGLGTNGLSTPTPVDINGDGNVDVIYAGDLNGNMWRFNVTSATAADWAVDYAGAPLFVAKNAAPQRQPIIAPPEVMPHTQGTTSGHLLLFGTGKFIEGTDRTNADEQTFYGVWDRGAVGFSNLTRANLHDSGVDTQATLGSLTYRTMSGTSTPAYCTDATLVACNTAFKHLGWYWDMSVSGERLTGRVNLISGTVLFNTFYPATSGGTLDPCQYGGDGWLMGLNATTGLMEGQFPVFDLNQDGVLDSSDTSAAGIRIGAALGGTTFARGLGEGKIGIYSPTNLGTAASEGKKMTTNVNVPPGTTGRVSWIELLD
ncbi:MAG: PilC/PilY family type IV pilus protein [Pseudomonadota bacterium]|nr:PilC/PilY family type IV pilus protein [Pseudomonadota bacterium]